LCVDDGHAGEGDDILDFHLFPLGVALRPARAKTWAKKPHPTIAVPLLLPLARLCVDDGDAGEVDDVFDFIAPLEDVDGFVHADEHRAGGLRAAEPLEQLISDVARSRFGNTNTFAGSSSSEKP